MRPALQVPDLLCPVEMHFRFRCYRTPRAWCIGVRWDDLSVTATTADAKLVSGLLRRIELCEAYPELPEDIQSGLKFGLCLSDDLARRVLVTRTSSAEMVSDRVGRPFRLVIVPERAGRHS